MKSIDTERYTAKIMWKAIRWLFASQIRNGCSCGLAGSMCSLFAIRCAVFTKYFIVNCHWLLFPHVVIRIHGFLFIFSHHFLLLVSLFFCWLYWVRRIAFPSNMKWSNICSSTRAGCMQGIDWTKIENTQKNSNSSPESNINNNILVNIIRMLRQEREWKKERKCQRWRKGAEVGRKKENQARKRKRTWLWNCDPSIFVKFIVLQYFLSWYCVWTELDKSKQQKEKKQFYLSHCILRIVYILLKYDIIY